MNSQSGQATVEALAAIPLLLLAGAIVLQLLVTGYAMSVADGAAEAGALALADGHAAAAAARRALPDWAEGRTYVSVSQGRVSVRVTPPSPSRSLAEALAVTSSAFARGAAR